MAIDWAKERDRTQILIAEIGKNKAQKYVFWKEIDPKKGKIGYTEQIKYVKDVFWRFKPMIIPDSSGQQDTYIELLTSGENAIPPGFIFKEDPSVPDKMGFKATGERNYNMHRIHKKYILDGMVKFPAEEVFLEKWVGEHNAILTKPIMGGSAVGFDCPRIGYKDLCVTAAMLSYAVSRDSGPACHMLGVF